MTMLFGPYRRVSGPSERNLSELIRRTVRMIDAHAQAKDEDEDSEKADTGELQRQTDESDL